MEILAILQDINFIVIDYIIKTPWWVLMTEFFVVWVIYFVTKGIYYLLVIRLSGRHQEAQSYNRGSEQRILLVGDSTAVGTGAKDVQHTLAGFLARDFPGFTIVNKGINGAMTRAVLTQLASVKDERFNLTLISIGGNDVWSLVGKRRVRKDITAVLQAAKQVSEGRVVLLFFGNEGSAPFFPFLLRWILLRRTKMVRKIFSEAAMAEEVPFIELFSRPQENPFVKDPKQNFAPDGLHPNEYGYWAWYKHLWRLLVEKDYLRKKNHTHIAAHDF